MAQTKDFDDALRFINNSQCVLITSHTRPDGDACGSIAAMMMALKKLGKKSMPLLLSPLPQWYSFLFETKVPVLGEDLKIEDLDRGDYLQCDGVIIIDTNSYIQLPQFDLWLKKKHKPVLVLDHHVTSDGLGDVEVIDTTAAAAGQIVLDLFKHARWDIDPAIAAALFVSLSTDTGWFRFSNTDSRVYGDAGRLIDAGARPADIYQVLYQNFSVERFRLLTLLMERVEFLFDNRVAIGYVNFADFAITGATARDTENLIDEYRRVGSVEVAVLCVEQKDSKIRCSLRSRGGVDVQAIASKFGGGGHKAAAGVTLDGPCERAKQIILGELGAIFGDKK
ncbi:MAG: hypothetical protein A2Y07_08960 [Planctomycetes bacterium GWF2_50_10]|nr:MAG: hypothetical protein A2Y07_08960 [Planctomycetes bacterium GWF2_50_10]